MLLNGPLFASIRAPDFLAGVPSGLSSKTEFCPGTRNSRCYHSLNQILKLLSGEWADEGAAHFSLEDAECGKKTWKKQDWICWTWLVKVKSCKSKLFWKINAESFSFSFSLADVKVRCSCQREETRLQIPHTRSVFGNFIHFTVAE